MKKTRKTRKLNSLKSVAKPCNAFRNATMYFLEPKKSLRQSMVGWILEAPTGPSEGRIWYDRMKEKRQARLNVLEQLKTHLATATNAMQTGDRDIFDKAVACIDKMLSDVPPIAPKASTIRLHQSKPIVLTDELGQPTPVSLPGTYAKKYGKDFTELVDQWNDFMDRPGKFQINSSFRTPQDKIVPMNVSYQEDDKK